MNTGKFVILSHNLIFNKKLSNISLGCVCVCVCVCACVHSTVFDYSQPHGLLPGSSVQGVFQARILGGLPFPSPVDLPDPGIILVSPALAEGFFPTGATWEA